MSTGKMLTLSDLFTEAEIEKAKEIFAEAKPGQFNKLVVSAVVEPAMGRINQKTQQENDPNYIGYLIEHVFTQSGMKQGRRLDDDKPKAPGHG